MSLHPVNPKLFLGAGIWVGFDVFEVVIVREISSGNNDEKNLKFILARGGGRPMCMPDI